MRYLIFLLLMAGISCSSEDTESPSDLSHAQTDSLSPGWLVADSILYDVVIKNPDPSDEWVNTNLKYLEREKWLDEIFSAIYHKKLKAFDYYTGEELSVRAVKKIEKETDFDRNKIAKIQFTEKWYFDSKTLTMNKKVIHMVIGYEYFNSHGELRGYKAAFTVKMN